MHGTTNIKIYIGTTAFPVLHSSDFKIQYHLRTNDARCTSDIKSRNAIADAAFNQNQTIHRQIGLKLKAETSEMLYRGADKSLAGPD